MTDTTHNEISDIGGDYKYGFHDEEKYVFKAERGLTREVVENISRMKKEPEWMRDFRLKAYDIYMSKPMPTWGDTKMLGEIDFDNIYYYLKPANEEKRSWDDVPEDIRRTFDRLGIPEAERKFLAGVSAQYESEIIYHSIREDIEKLGVKFFSMDEGLREMPEMVKKYFATVIPPNDNKFAALNSAVWSGGSFIYVPKGVHVAIPLQAYFRINAENMGQFERTLIIVDEGASAHYLEGCTAPTYSSDSLHSAVVELIALPGAKLRYTTIQNWSKNVYNLVTKRAKAFKNASVEWVDGNLGCVTADTQIFTNPHGPIAIKDIETNAMIYAVNLNTLCPEKKRVVAKRCTGTRKTYLLTTENYRSIKATDNHPFLALAREPFSNRTTLQWQRLDQLREGQMIGIARGLPDEGKPRELSEFQNLLSSSTRMKNIPCLPRTTSPRLMWLLGLYIGDGFTEFYKEIPRRISFAVPPKDRARAKLEKLIPEIFDINWKPKKNCVTISSVILAKFLMELGMGGNAHKKRIPAWIYGLPANERLSFIEGFMDADGCIRKQKKVGGKEFGQIVFASCNKTLLEDMRMLMISVGLNPLKISTYVKERKLRKGRLKEYVSYYLCLNIKDNLDKIRNKKSDTEHIEFVRIKSIEPQGMEEVFDIEVEDSHNFIANGIIVHNSKLTMKYPAVYLMEPGAHGEVLSIAFAGKGQHQDAGAKMVHLAPNTTSVITSKSISKDDGRTTYRGLVKVTPNAEGCKSSVKCDALLLNEGSRSDTYPTMEIACENVTIGHEATVSKVGDEQLFYLRSRGIKEDDAAMMIVNGFIEPFTKELPLEYAVELNRLIQLEMEGSVG